MSHLRSVALLCISCTFIFLVSCQKGDDTDSQTILTLQVDADYGLLGDNWVFVTDGTGAVLAAEPFAKGKTVTLTSEKRLDKVDVTIFYYWEVPLGVVDNRISFNTYAGVPVGTVMHLKATIPSDLGTEKQAHFTFSNFDGGDIMFSNGKEDYNYRLVDDVQGNEANVPFYGGGDILMSAYRSGVPVYNWARGVSDGDEVSRDFANDFTPLEHQMTLNFEGKNTARVTASNSATDEAFYIMDTYFIPKAYASDHPVIGAVDGFNVFYTTVTNTKANGQVVYEKAGAFNTAFTIPTFTFSLVKSDIQDYAFTFSQDYTYHMAEWSYIASSSYIWWDVHAPTGTTVKGLTVPADIVAKYPAIDMSKFAFNYASFTQVIEGWSFLETVPGTTRTWHPVYEMYTYYPKP
jgi:hypothetical protein